MTAPHDHIEGLQMKALKLCCLAEALDEVIDFEEYRSSIAVPLLHEIKSMAHDLHEELESGWLRQPGRTEGAE